MRLALHPSKKSTGTPSPLGADLLCRPYTIEPSRPTRPRRSRSKYPARTRPPRSRHHDRTPLAKSPNHTCSPAARRQATLREAHGTSSGSHRRSRRPTWRAAPRAHGGTRRQRPSRGQSPPRRPPCTRARPCGRREPLHRPHARRSRARSPRPPTRSGLTLLEILLREDNDRGFRCAVNLVTYLSLAVAPRAVGAPDFNRLGQRCSRAAAPDRHPLPVCKK